MIQFIRNLLEARREQGERGASAVEYGLLVAGIAAVVVVAVFALGSTITGAFEDTNTSINTPSAPASS